LESEVEIIKEAADKKVKNEVSGFHGGNKVTGRTKSNKDPKKLSKDVPEEFVNKGAISKLTQEITSLRAMIKSAVLNDGFIPNRKLHLDKWAEGINTKGAFTGNIDETVVSDIMALKGVDNLWKVLLMMGIGVFINHENITYTEIMKKMADEQKLYMIIASSDYIYGTNYQFCHGFLSKDLNLTQEKIIQAMGRIGRNNIQQNYTVRFRDDEQILKLFTSETDKPEIINMNILFNTRKVIWQNNQYIEIEDDLMDDAGNDEDEEVNDFEPDEDMIAEKGKSVMMMVDELEEQVDDMVKYKSRGTPIFLLCVDNNPTRKLFWEALKGSTHDEKPNNNYRWAIIDMGNGTTFGQCVSTVHYNRKIYGSDPRILYPNMQDLSVGNIPSDKTFFIM
jgi:hypothetical protein